VRIGLPDYEKNERGRDNATSKHFHGLDLHLENLGYLRA